MLRADEHLAPARRASGLGDGSCGGGCAAGTVCVQRHVVNKVEDVGCAPVSAGCAGAPSCACMAKCVCPGQAPYGCIDDPTALACDDGAISLRAAKDGIRYVDAAEHATLARELLAVRLARYRYKHEPAAARRRLGFLIDDQPAECPAVDSDGAHVDLYGYASMLVATVQHQAKRIRRLERRIEAIERGNGSAPVRRPATGRKGR